MVEDVNYAALAVQSRRRILDTLRAADGPTGVSELVTVTGLHANTVRFHLEVLVEAGFVSSGPGPRRGRGRPPTVYRSVTPPAPSTGYQFLSQVLAAQLDDRGAGELAEQAGRSWLRGDGRSAAAPPGADPVGVATARALALFTELGFEPERAADSATVQIDLHACPFLEVAQRHPDVVCAMHRGLLREVVEAAAPGLAAELIPFARPGVCVARLTPTEKGPVRS
ncbi:helix-turn-helix transcriptional regulator [Micromonospora sp. DT47]|uniref:helix-turn-helix transcriptional regulator n=1 Tax=Micromonospora sp. DT47 TaxID=3393431 RepID=UPI003CF70865